MKERKTGILSLLGLTGSYFLVRYPLFFLHGMKEWPFDLFILGAVVITLSGLVYKGKVLPVLTAAGYLVGFFVGYLFQTDYGIDLNSLWLIWSGVYLACILLGFVADRRNVSPRAKRVIIGIAVILLTCGVVAALLLAAIAHGWIGPVPN